MPEDLSGKMEEVAKMFERYAKVPDLEAEAKREAEQKAERIRRQMGRIEVALKHHEEHGGPLTTE
jgi:hypothetical protein